MKAIIYHKYGSPDVLQLKEIDKPTIGDNDVLVRVRATSVNPYDWHFMRGKPYFMRMMIGLLRPKVNRLGVDLAGQVEAIGQNVTQFRPGDEVFGAVDGAFAEYISAPEGALVLKPVNLTFEQAAAARLASLTALQGLRDKGQVQPGQKVLINGASGGIGTFAVQIAKSFGAEVTGVCSTRNVAMVRKIGADHVIDYTQEDFTLGEPCYDLMFDTVGNRSLLECRRTLATKGTYVIVGGPVGGRWLGPMTHLIRTLVLSLFVSQKVIPLNAKRNKEDLLVLKALLETGKIVPVIDRHYPLSEVPEAIRYLEEGHARGKIVITV